MKILTIGIDSNPSEEPECAKGGDLESLHCWLLRSKESNIEVELFKRCFGDHERIWTTSLGFLSKMLDERELSGHREEVRLRFVQTAKRA